MDETVTNGAQLYYPDQFGIGQNQLLIGFVNSAPYVSRNTINHSSPDIVDPVMLCSVFLLGTTNIFNESPSVYTLNQVTDPLNHYFGRRGTICITAVISFFSCFWQSFTNSWRHLFVGLVLTVCSNFH